MTSTWLTCSAVTRSPSTRAPLPPSSPSGSCSSPGRGDRSAPSCAARSPASNRRASSSSTGTSRRCTASSSISTARGCSTNDNIVLADIRDLETLRARSSRSTSPTSSSTPRPSSTCRCSSATRWRRGKTNVLGTLNVLDGGRGGRRRDLRQHLDRQGRRPHRVLGYSKRIAERLTAGFAARDAGSLHQCPVRERPRVAGLRASPAFTAQIRRGGPVTDHPPGGRALLHADPGGVPAGACRPPRWAPRRGARPRHG